MSDKPTIAERRKAFAADGADGLARSLGTPPRRTSTSGWTTRAVWYEDDSQVMAVVGEHEEKYTDLALAHGLFHAGKKRLCLVLPKGWERPTLQRAPWFDKEVQVYVHDGRDAFSAELP